LLFPTGQQSEWHVGVGQGAHGIQQFIAADPGCAGARQAPPVPVQSEAHQVPGADVPGRGAAALRDQPDGRISTPGRLFLDGDLAGGERQLPEQNAEQAGLPGPVGPEHGEQFAGFELQFQVLPDGAGPEAQRRPVQADGAHDRAASRASRLCDIQET
jgi:hypothetical protein